MHDLPRRFVDAITAWLEKKIRPSSPEHHRMWSLDGLSRPFLARAASEMVD